MDTALKISDKEAVITKAKNPRTFFNSSGDFVISFPILATATPNRRLAIIMTPATVEINRASVSVAWA
jgi:hypothetical protein